MVKKAIKKILVCTGGGDCPGLNTVIRAIVKSAYHEPGWAVYGSIQAFNGVLNTPLEIIKLDPSVVAGIHVQGGTILQTSNKSDPFHYATTKDDGTVVVEDRSALLVERLNQLNIYAVISIGGDGSQRISQKLCDMDVNVVGVPKTIDNDLYATEMTFGFQTAVEIATEAVDKLVSTAASHNRVMIAEVMGRDAGWICLHTAIASGAEIALIPEIPYDIDVIVKKLQKRIKNGRGFANIVIAEGAHSKDSEVSASESQEAGYQNRMLGGIGHQLMNDIRKIANLDARVAVLGHVQRGGGPIAFDRVLATQMGVKAFDLVQRGKFGHMVSYHRSTCTSVPIKAAVSVYNTVDIDHHLIKTARKIGICLGDKE